MALKVTFFFNVGSQGFTETWYSTLTDPQAFVLNLREPFYKKAVQWRSPLCQFYAIRASVVGQRSSYTLNLAQLNYTGDTVPALVINPDLPDVTSTDSVWKIYGANGRSRSVFLRGLRDTDVVRNANGIPQPSPFLTDNVKQYFRTLQGANLTIQFVKRPPLNNGVWNPVTLVAPLAANSPASVLTLANDVIYDGSPPILSFRGVPRNDLPGFPKNAVLIAQAAGPPKTVTIPWRYRAATATYAPFKMAATPLVFDYTTLSGWAFVSFNEHKTGKAFGVPRGRSRAVVLAK